jgi:hypothetical protein
VRLRNADAGHADSLHLLGRRELVELVPDDVAPRQQRRLVGQLLRRRRRVVCGGLLRKRVAEAGEALRAKLERVDEVLVEAAEWTRRVDQLRLVVGLLGLLRVRLEARLEIRLLQTGASSLFANSTPADCELWATSRTLLT